MTFTWVHHDLCTPPTSAVQRVRLSSGIAACVRLSSVHHQLPRSNWGYLRHGPNVGYLRHDPNVCDCPVHTTNFRGPTYVFLATLKTKETASKWALAGVALVFQGNV